MVIPRQPPVDPRMDNKRHYKLAGATQYIRTTFMKNKPQLSQEDCVDDREREINVDMAFYNLAPGDKDK